MTAAIVTGGAFALAAFLIGMAVGGLFAVVRKVVR